MRFVLLKGIDERGVEFFTNYESRKGRELAANPRAALAILWKPLQRQVRLEGPVEVLTAEESDAYFATRSRGSQLGAWASRQSEVIPGREWLEARLAAFDDAVRRRGPAPAALGRLNPRAGLAILWKPLQRQVRLEGPVELLSAEENDAYFATRSRGSQLGAWASRQSEVIPDREWLEARLAEYDAQFTDVPRPEHWGGYRLVPELIEFWEGRPNRLHDREAFTRGSDGAWHARRLAP